MTIEGIERNIQPADEAFAVFSIRMRDGRVDPVCSLVDGVAPEADSNIKHIVALDGDDFRGPLGLIEIEETGQTPQMTLELANGLKEQPALLRQVLSATLEHVERQQAVIEHANVPDTILEKAGAVALEGHGFTFCVEETRAA